MFKTIGVFGKYQDSNIATPLKLLTEHLEGKGLVVKLGHTTAEEISNHLPQERLDEIIDNNIDLAIVIGGDGTLLHVARSTARHNIPVVGVNLGRLGFLTDIARTDMLSEIDRILTGHYRIEERMMLNVSVIKNDEIVHQQIALNDVVVGKHAFEKLISWQVDIDNKFVTTSRSDAVILCTPTGSTAYALSAGGPIVHPGIDVLAIVPVSPHTLSNRPIVVPAASVIEFTITDKRYPAHVSADGLIGFNLEGDEIIRVSRSEHSVQLVHPENYNYFATLRSKLGWGEG